MKRTLINTPSQNCHFFIWRILSCGLSRAERSDECFPRSEVEAQAVKQSYIYKLYDLIGTSYFDYVCEVRSLRSARCPYDIIVFMQLKYPAPDFELPDLEGKLHRLSDYRGRIVIVNFWSAECPHSERTDRSTMACLVQWGEGVVMLCIAANRSESVQIVNEAAKTRRLPTVLMDAE